MRPVGHLAARLFFVVSTDVIRRDPHFFTISCHWLRSRMGISVVLLELTAIHIGTELADGRVHGVLCGRK
jgi:hypothetical protein